MSHKEAKAERQRYYQALNKQWAEAPEIASAMLARWRRRTVWLGVPFLAAIGGVIPFVAGLPLHYLWKPVGLAFLFLSMALLVPFLWTAGMTYGFWRYERDIKRITKQTRQ